MAKTLIGNIKGPKGDRGADGVRGVQGPAGATGATGPQGLDGDSAYQVAVNNGFEGSEEDWLASLEGGTFVGTITGTIATATDSTDAPIISLKSNGYTEQDGTPTPDVQIEIEGLDKVSVKTCGKNIFGGLALENKIVGVVSGATKNEDTGSVQFSGSAIAGHILFDSFKANTQYTFIFYGKNLGSLKYLNMCVYYSDGTNKLMLFPETDYSNFVFTSEAGKTIKSLEGVYQDSVTILYPEKCGVFEGVITVDDFEPYTETVAEIDLTEPLYEGDYIEYRADGTGVLYRKMEKVVFDSEEDVRIMSFEANNYVAFKPKVEAKKNNINTYSNYYKTVDAYDLNNIPENGILVNHNGDIVLKDERYATLEEYKSWLQSNPVTVVYELETPQEIELTAEQLAQLKNLRTFEPVTNVFCEGETTIQYYKNTTSGVAISKIHSRVNELEKNNSVEIETLKIVGFIKNFGYLYKNGNVVQLIIEYCSLAVAAGTELTGIINISESFRPKKNCRLDCVSEKDIYITITRGGGIKFTNGSDEDVEIKLAEGTTMTWIA